MCKYCDEVLLMYTRLIFSIKHMDILYTYCIFACMSESFRVAVPGPACGFAFREAQALSLLGLQVIR